MNPKQIKLTINPEDVRALAASSLSRIFSRLQRKTSEGTLQLEKNLQSGTQRDTLETLYSILENYHTVIEEINNLTPLVQEIEDLVVPNTEVVEDLPDL
jgi:hypothetical protein